MKARIVSGLVLVVAVIAVLLWAPAWVTLCVVLAAVLASAWEWSAFLRAASAAERVAFVVVVAGLLAGAWFATADPDRLRLLLGIAAAWWVVALVLLWRGPAGVTRVLAWTAGVLVLVPAGIALMRLRVDLAHGAAWTLYVLMLVWAADTGAYAAGKAFGRHRLAPEVSPGKTWEGVAGGLVLSAAVAVASASWLEQPVGPLVVVSLVVAVFSVVGDLTESLFKRFAGVKDSGQLIPGHGGLMDRLDSITAAAPLLLLGALELLTVP